MNTSTKYFLAVLAAAIAIGGITFLNRADNGNGKLVNKVDRSIRPIETTVATPTTLEETIERTGVLEPARDVQLTSEVAGKVRRVHRDLGDSCKTGETLISLDAETYRIALQDALASLEHTRAGLSEAERNHGRAEKLEARDLASDQDMDRARSAVDTARAMNQRAEAAVALARRNLREATIRCPFPGVVAERMVDVGELVGPQTPLMRFVDHKELKLTLTVSAAELSRLRVGQPVDLADPSIPGAAYRGSVARLGVAADPATRTFPVEVSVEPGPRPGQVVRSVIHVAVHESAMVVAIDAVRFTESGPCVFVVDGGTARRRMVELGARVGNRVVVASGIEPGDQLVTVGVHGLESGDAVRPVDRPAEAGAEVTAEELTKADAAPGATAQAER
jgi:RND family efflux transporter MFP subunit